MMKVIIFCALALILALGTLFAKPSTVATLPQPRYDCEDNSDTTKGHYKGVLTHCAPVKITRTM